jgi:hypothetical protein
LISIEAVPLQSPLQLTLLVLAPVKLGPAKGAKVTVIVFVHPNPSVAVIVYVAFPSPVKFPALGCKTAQGTEAFEIL